MTGHPTPASAAPSQAVSSVEKRIAAVRNKMIGTVVVILALGIWQKHFVLDGIAAHMEITLTILGTFAFSIALAFIFVAKLKNEIVAYQALREMWDDIQHSAQRGAQDTAWRLERCHRPAQVFERPRLLGHAYELVTEEIARTKKIRVSVETMNTLVHTVESSINDEKSLIIYLSGLLVFMGLIGTFIGLLHMVGSIGGIIGSLAGSASGADSSGAFGELLSALQEPLKGMASGFAASLFGLFSSLVVGLLGRFAGQAAGVLKSEFEGWLASVVQIGEEEEENQRGMPVLARGAGALDDPALLRMVGNILTDYTRVAGQFDSVSRTMQALQSGQTRQNEAIEAISHHLAALQATQGDLAANLQHGSPHQTDALADQFAAFASQISAAIGAEQAGMRAVINEMSQQHGANLRLLTANQQQTANRLAEAIEMVSADIARRTEATLTARSRDEAEFDAAARALNAFESRNAARFTSLERDLAVLASSQTALVRTLEAGMARGGLDTGEGAGAESGISEGLSRINQTMDAALTAYSGLLHVALAALERADRAPAEAPAATQARTTP